VLPPDFGFVNEILTKKKLSSLIDDLIEKFGGKIAAETLDKIKNLGFDFATKSGITMSIFDMTTPLEKTKKKKLENNSSKDFSLSKKEKTEL